MKILITKNILTLFVTSIIFSFNAYSQIVYTDIIPDATFLCNGNITSTKIYHLDLNNDGANDFNIICFSNTAHAIVRRVEITPQQGNSYITDPINAVKINFLNDTIGLAQVWNDTTTQYLRLYALTGYRGEWINETDKYLGLELIVGSQAYFGWARLDVNVDSLSSTFTIKDYAYNSTPNQFIIAGDTGLGSTGIIENIVSSSIIIYPNPASNILTITLGSINKQVEVTITEITGKIIYRTTAGETQKIEVNIKDFAEGTYVVLIQAVNFIETKKFIVKK